MMGFEPMISSSTSYCSYPFATSPTELMLFFFLLFLIGILGIVVNRKNLLTLLMSIELMLLAINLLLISASLSLDSLFGQLFAFIILVVAAAESAVGLSILVAYFRVKGTIAIQFIHLLRG
jgi:NADH:ubiquinone oxidoreductase subunit K